MSAGSFTKKVICEFAENNQVELVGVIPDPSLPGQYLEEFDRFLKKMQIPCLNANTEDLKKADIIYVCEYRKILPPEIVNNFLCIGLHAGILPKWRGFAANAWAIINGEDEIGYSFFRINEKMDDGDLYFVRHIKITHTQTYSDVHDQMIDQMLIDSVEILTGIFEKKITGQVQTGERCYGHRFSPEMGCIRDFNVTSDYIYGLFRAMSKPLGTGLYLIYKGEKIEVSHVWTGKMRNIADYIGIPGKIVNKETHEIWVKTRDNLVILEVADAGIFSIGSQLDEK